MVIDNSKSLSADIFEITDYIHEIKKNYVDIPDETLYLGIFGYTSEIFSNVLQNAIVMAAEYSNESIPSKAKFERNIIANALSLGITDINAKPSSMGVMILFKKEDIEKNLYNDTFVLSRDFPIYIEDYEFHFDYDIILRRNTLATSDTDIYIATYDLTDADGEINKYWNKASDIDSPYLKSPAVYTAGDIPTIGVYASISQVSLLEIENKILTNNVIENKTMTFEFEDQLCTFRVLSTKNGVTTILTPIYEGTYDSKVENYCYYQYLDSHTIRIKFDNTVKGYPDMNTVITVQAQTTKGEAGNFEYRENIIMSYKSDANMTHKQFPHLEYTNIYMDIKPSESTGGRDRKDMDTLRKIIAKEAVSRGSISTESDLENYFNMIDTGYSNTFFFKKEDNVLTRLYSSFIVMKDNSNNIIPTNTIDVILPMDSIYINKSNTEKDLEDDVLHIPAMSKITYAKDFSVNLPENMNSFPFPIENNNKYYGTLLSDNSGISLPTDEDGNVTVNHFEYALPFSITSRLNTQVCSYFLNNFEVSRTVEFEGTNSQNNTQFIASSLIWKRDTTSSNTDVANTYTLSIEVMENDSSDTMMIGDRRVVRVPKKEDEPNGETILKSGESVRLPIGTNISYAALDSLNLATKLYTATSIKEVHDILSDYIKSGIINQYDNDSRLTEVQLTEDSIWAQIPGKVEDKNDTVIKHNTILEIENILLRNSYCKVKAIAVFKSKAATGYAIADEVLIKANDSQSGYVYTVNFNIKTNENIDANNNIGMILNWVKKETGYQDKYYYTTDENKTPVNIGYDVETEIYFLTYKNESTDPALKNLIQSNQKTKELNQNVLCARDFIYSSSSDSFVGSGEGSKNFAISNIYKVTDGAPFMFNYSNIINSTITISSDSNWVMIKSLPVVGYDYITDVVNMKIFISEIEKRRNYINYVLDLLEDTTIDFKFVNTFGPSKIFVICDQPTAKSSSDYKFLDNIQMEFYFAVKLTSSSNNYIIDYIKSFIKDEIENLDTLSEIHIPNITAAVKEQYKEQIVYFEYLGTARNGNGTYENRTNQHISKYNDEATLKNPDYVPEFLNIALADDGYSPNITILTV